MKANVVEPVAMCRPVGIAFGFIVRNHQIQQMNGREVYRLGERMKRLRSGDWGIFLLWI